MIGSTNTKLGFHGYIVLLAFVPEELVQSGVFTEVRAGKGNVNRGKSLGVTRASNKGAVVVPRSCVTVLWSRVRLGRGGATRPAAAARSAVHRMVAGGIALSACVPLAYH